MSHDEPPLLTSSFETRLVVDRYPISRPQPLATGISPIPVYKPLSDLNALSKWIHANGFAVTNAGQADRVRDEVSQVHIDWPISITR